MQLSWHNRAKNSNMALRPAWYGSVRHAWVPMLGVQGGMVFDAVGSKHGTLAGTAFNAMWGTGQKGTKLTFNGTDQGLCIPDGTHVGLTKELTYVILLYKPASGGHAYGRIVDKYPAASLYIYNNTVIREYIQIGGSSKETAIGETLPKDQWVVVTVVFSQGSQKCYYNGVQSGAGTTYAGDYSEGTGVNMAIGNRCLDYARGTNVSIGSFLLIPRALTVSEILEITNDILLPLRPRRVMVPMYVPSGAVFKPYWCHNPEIIGAA